jgi:hypothetical protein
MKLLERLPLAALLVATTALGLRAQQTPPAAVFFAVDVVLDTGGESLAAWQVEIVDRSGVARVVGVEGGEHPAFAQPAYYDPRALQQGRIVLAAFQTEGELPAGRVRVARVHFQAEGPVEPALEIHPMASADAQGRSFPVRVELLR